MKNIGILVVEVDSVLRRYKDKLDHELVGGFDTYQIELGDYKLIFAHTDYGLIRAAACSQMLIDKFNIELLINYGVVGSLRADLNVEDICFVDKVVHYGMDTSPVDKVEVGRYMSYPDVYLRTSEDILNKVKNIYSHIPLLTDGCADKFLDKKEDKEAIARTYDADICDMESAAVVIVSDLNRIPNLIIKIVSDSLSGGADEYSKSFQAASDKCLEIVEEIIKEQII